MAVVSKEEKRMAPSASTWAFWGFAIQSSGGQGRADDLVGYPEQNKKDSGGAASSIVTLSILPVYTWTVWK